MKQKKLYYECVNEVELNFMAPDHRKERWSGLRAPIVPHPIRFKPADPLSGRPGDVLMSYRPIAKHLTTSITKNVRRKNLRTGEYTMQETQTKVKFQLVDPDDMTDDIKRRARDLDLPDDCYAEDREEVRITEVV